MVKANPGKVDDLMMGGNFFFETFLFIYFDSVVKCPCCRLVQGE